MTAAAIPSSDVRMWSIIVPDVPANLGGSKVVINAANYKINQTINVDLTSARRRFNYNATYHTNKIRFIFKHDEGYQLKILFNMNMMRKYDI